MSAVSDCWKSKQKEAIVMRDPTKSFIELGF